ncbi:MAG: ABC transporter ATP-binding protein [Clostridiales bacterium]|nr:ABC transporter ATP-binding protein [Clostridiales bacterium]
MTTLIRTENLTKKYSAGNRFFCSKTAFTAVNNVSLEIREGESLGLIGESGCGKSTFGRAVCGLEKITEGKLFLGETDVTNLSKGEFRPYRKNIQMVFQNNLSAFNPKYTMYQSIEEVLKNFEELSKSDTDARIKAIFRSVGLDEKLLYRYPHQMSGGERQRANIARAIVLNPKVVICDEAVASLDYALRKSILKLLNDISGQYGVTYLFITHDLSTIRYVCSKIAVMYLGEVVEIMDVENMEQTMLHPYTKALFQSVLITDPVKRGTICRDKIGELEYLPKVETGCVFYNRCKYCTDRCQRDPPQLQQAEKGHMVACHNIEAFNVCTLRK